MREQAAICGLYPHGCWVKAHISEGELVAVTADTHPQFGNLCERGRRAPQTVYSPDRVKTPLIRSGPKGKLLFKEATWDEALKKIAEAFMEIRSRHGARAVASYMGAGTLEDGLTAFFKKVLEPFGSPNDMDCGSVCYVSSRVIAPLTTLSIEGDAISPDFEKSSSIILWGTNPLKDGTPDKVKRIREARRNGAELIVIDPRKSGLAKEADLWVPVHPGTDGALALALINIIIQKQWFDKRFIEHWTTGFPELAAYSATFTPEKAGVICGVDPELIIRLASVFSEKSRVAIDFYSGLEYAPSGVQNTQALYALAALSGNLDADGGLYIHTYPHHPYHEHIFDEDAPPLGAREYPLFYALAGRAHIAGLPAAVLHDDPYPLRGLLLVGGSPYLSYPDPEMWKRVYQQLDFMTVIDRFLPEEAVWADVILPATTYYEIDSYHLYRTHVRRRHKIIEPVGESRNDSMILAAIASHLGYGSLFPQTEKELRELAFNSDPEMLGAIDSHSGLARLPFPKRRVLKHETGHLRSDGKPGFPTPSGRFEFKSELLERYGYDPLPVYTDPRVHHKNKNLTLMLTTGARTTATFNSQYLSTHGVGARRRPTLEINPVDAQSRGIGHGDCISLFTCSGEVLLEAQVTEFIRQGTVHAPFGGGSQRRHGPWRYAHINSVIPPQVRDPISGYPVVKAVACEVDRVDEVKRGDVHSSRVLSAEVSAPD